MINLELFGGFDFTQTDERTNERTFGVVESLSRLKMKNSVRKMGISDKDLLLQLKMLTRKGGISKS